ncbi:GIN domain-containing protein [Roseivirga sp. BDSF3-8]|uniref:GIN domain-containing protein n=1 Tax=Roseivirga sp. BDSF3-8 TaxID=3241598 RepID=UPI00353259EE
MKKILPLIFALLCIHAGFVRANTPVNTVHTGPGKEIDLPAFTSLSIKGGGTYYIHYSRSSKIEIKGAGRCLDEVEATVSYRELSIGPAENATGNCPIEVHIYTSALSSIQQKGGGSISIMKGFPPVESFKCSLKGGGDMNLSALRIGSLHAAIKGGGQVMATVEKSLHGEIKGGGRLYYQGDPAVKKEISGGGTIESR